MTAEPLVIQDVDAFYGRRQILHGVSLTVGVGEVFGLVGLNGVGKTTLIRSVLGLTACDGEISLFGRPHTDPKSREGLLYLPEKYQPSSYLTGWEHLEMAQRWLSGPLDRSAAALLAADLAFDPVALDRRVSTYSKGMGQKLGLVAALSSALPLLVLDEPMSGLDPRARVRLKDQLLAYKASGRSVFFSSHILADVEEICDRIGVIHRGRLIYSGAPEAFIGSNGGGTLERAFLSAVETDEGRVLPG